MNIVFVELEMERSWSVASIGPAFLAAVARKWAYLSLITVWLRRRGCPGPDYRSQARHSGNVLDTRQWLRARAIIAAFEQHRLLGDHFEALPHFSPEEVLQAPGIDAVCLGERAGLS